VVAGDPDAEASQKHKAAEYQDPGADSLFIFHLEVTQQQDN
jgi:hypothetical protein